MVFSDTTNKDGIIQRCEFNLSLPDGTITGDSTLFAQMTGLVNDSYYEIVTEILASQDAWDFDDVNHTDYSIATTPMVASQRDYSFPSSLEILKIKRVDLTYDGTNFYRSKATDSASMGFGLGDDTNEDRNFAKSAPVHDIKADTIWVYPLPTADDVANGAKIRIESIRNIHHLLKVGKCLR